MGWIVTKKEPKRQIGPFDWKLDAESFCSAYGFDEVRKLENPVTAEVEAN